MEEKKRDLSASLMAIAGPYKIRYIGAVIFAVLGVAGYLAKILFSNLSTNVDPENEGRLQAAIETLVHHKTIIMIAHRLKTVRNADQILVLD